MARPLSLKKAANKKRALRKRGRKPLSKKRVLKAILHSGGLRSKIAEACHVSVSTLSKYLKKDSWQDVREALHDEEQRVADNAEKAIQDAINQRNDISTAASTAKWYLERKTPERGYAKQETLKLTQDPSTGGAPPYLSPPPPEATTRRQATPSRRARAARHPQTTPTPPHSLVTVPYLKCLHCGNPPSAPPPGHGPSEYCPSCETKIHERLLAAREAHTPSAGKRRRARTPTYQAAPLSSVDPSLSAPLEKDPPPILERTPRKCGIAPSARTTHSPARQAHRYLGPPL